MLKRLVLAFAVGCLTASPAYPYAVSPLNLALDPVGDGAVERLRIENPGAKPVTLSISVWQALIAEDGSIEEVPADDDFLIFPPQMIVGPQQTQVVQLRYVGEPSLAQSHMFLVRTEQVPVDLESGDSQVNLQVGVNFVTVVEVAPDGAAAKLDLASFTPTQEGLQVRITNSGNLHGHLRPLQFAVTGSSGTKTIAINDLEVGRSSRVPPNGARTILLPSSTIAGLGDISEVTLEQLPG